jgi:hypothetical protein
MKSAYKRIILLSFFLLTTFNSYSQEKYEFMSIKFLNTGEFLHEFTISMNGDQLLYEKIKLGSDERSNLNVNPLFKKVKEYQERGWEIMTFNEMLAARSTTIIYTAYLRKKVE